MSRESAPEFVRSGTQRDLRAYLDGWASGYLVSPEAWGSVLERGNAWLDVSGRNQVLLASYGVATAVAGKVTWESIPSGEPGRGCAPRAGQDPLWIRVPIVESSSVSVRSVQSPAARALSRTEASDFEWVPVFAEEQLVRRPAEVLVWPQPPGASSDDKAWAGKVRLATRFAAAGGYMKRSTPPDQMLATAGMVLTGDEVLGSQVSWLVASRFGRTVGELPSFDPSELSPGERSQMIVQVRKAVTDLVTRLGERFGVDMRQGPIPRMGSDDLRVAPGRRNYFSRAEVRAMPVGVFQEVGPYSAVEWTQRGRDGVAGRAAFCKVTERSYVAVYERVEGGWRWALETVDGSVHRGLRAEGLAESLPAAKSAALSEIEVRWPDVAGRVVTPVGSPVIDPGSGWVGVGDGASRSEQRVFDDRVSGVVRPGPGGRWVGSVHVDNAMVSQLPLSGSRDEAVRLVDVAAAGEMRSIAAQVPARADGLIAESAAGSQWDRGLLEELVAPGLLDEQRVELGDVDSLSAAGLVGLLASSGRVGPATSLAVVKAEGFDLVDAVSAIDETGLGRPGGVREISRLWGESVDRVATVARLTVEEFAQLGPTARQMLAFDPRAGLRSVGVQPLDWYTAGQDLMASGYSVADALRHVAAHGPSPETIAAGAFGVTEDAAVAVSVLATRVTPQDLVAVGSHFDVAGVDLVALTNRSGVGFATVATVAVECAGSVDGGWGLVVEAHGQAEVSPPARELFDDLLSGRPQIKPVVGVEMPDNVVELDFTQR